MLTSQILYYCQVAGLFATAEHTKDSYVSLTAPFYMSELHICADGILKICSPLVFVLLNSVVHMVIF